MTTNNAVEIVGNTWIEVMDALNGVKSIMNSNGFTRILRVYVDPSDPSEIHVLGVNTAWTEYVAGRYAHITRIGDRATLYWGQGHYYCHTELDDMWAEFDGLACVWDAHYDGEGVQ